MYPATDRPTIELYNKITKKATAVCTGYTTRPQSTFPVKNLKNRRSGAPGHFTYKVLLYGISSEESNGRKNKSNRETRRCRTEDTRATREEVERPNIKSESV